MGTLSFPKAGHAVTRAALLMACTVVVGCPELDPRPSLSAVACTAADFPVVLDASASTARAGRVTSFRWNFGDGTPELVTVEGRVQHSWAAPGQYDVTLVVVDGQDRVGRVVHVLEVVEDARSCAGPAPDAGVPRIDVSACELGGVRACHVDLGEVSVGGEGRTVIVVRNTGAADLVLGGASVVLDAAGVFRVDPLTALTVAPGGPGQPVEVTFRPLAEGRFGASLHVDSNAANLPTGEPVVVTLAGQTPRTPFPVLEVEPPFCDYGDVPWGDTLRCDVTLRNAGDAALDITGLSLDTLPGVFTSTDVPGAVFTLDPAETRVVGIMFTPPSVGQFDGVLVVESTDPARPTVDVPLTGRGVEVPPVAVPEILRVNGAPVSGFVRLHPLDRVELTGRASRAGRQGRTISGYHWELLERPDVSSVFLLSPDNVETALVFDNGTGSQGGLDVVGRYVVGLVVTDNAGVSNRPAATLVLEALPDADLHVQLTWADPRSDIDLHLVRGSRDRRFTDDDCYYQNCTDRPLPWFMDPAANPRLDIDDTSGFGPENTVIPRPAVGRYVVGVHLYASHGSSLPLTATVRVYVRGELRLDVTAELPSCQEYWDVVTVDWEASGVSLATDGRRSQVEQGFGCD